MSEIEILSRDEAAAFAEVWYDIANDDHFWVRWRSAALMRAFADAGLDASASLSALDIGCGHGAMRRALDANTRWTVDGCDLNRTALEMSAACRGRTLFYNIHDRRPELAARYDVVLLLDVIEHISDTTAFLESAAFHLKPGGAIIINVPALEALSSRYDTVVGHLRRYDKPMLRHALGDAHLNVQLMRYWGLSLVPIAIARKLYVRGIESTDAVTTAGFQPPAGVINALLAAVSAVETALLKSPPLGTSLLAIARKAA